MVGKPTKRSEAEAHVALLLAPYDENHEVDEHEVECCCVGHEAMLNARQRIEEEHPEWQSQREQILRQLKEMTVPVQGNDETEELHSRLDALHSEQERYFKLYYKQDPAYGQPDPDCDSCLGSGRCRTTVNPQGYWDWYDIGGRWTGVLDPEYDPYTDPLNFTDCERCDSTGQDPFNEGACLQCDGRGQRLSWRLAPVEVDVRKVSSIDPEILSTRFYAAVTPDGQWHSQGTVGWFGISEDVVSPEDWKNYLLDLQARHPDAYGVVVDCHI